MLISTALVVGVIASFWALLIWGSTFGDTAVCVAYDETLQRVHRIVDSAVMVLILCAWIGGLIAMSRTTGLRRVGAAVAIPTAVILLLLVSATLLARAPGWLDVSDDSSPACV